MMYKQWEAIMSVKYETVKLSVSIVLFYREY